MNHDDLEYRIKRIENSAWFWNLGGFIGVAAIALAIINFAKDIWHFLFQ